MEGKTRPDHSQPHSGQHDALVGVEIVLPGLLRRLLLSNYVFAEGCECGIKLETKPTPTNTSGKHSLVGQRKPKKSIMSNSGQLKAVDEQNFVKKELLSSIFKQYKIHKKYVNNPIVIRQNLSDVESEMSDGTISLPLSPIK